MHRKTYMHVWYFCFYKGVILFVAWVCQQIVGYAFIHGSVSRQWDMHSGSGFASSFGKRYLYSKYCCTQKILEIKRKRECKCTINIGGFVFLYIKPCQSFKIRKIKFVIAQQLCSCKKLSNLKTKTLYKHIITLQF